ncbi:MAG: hypothetical protein GEU80_04150 [Dehalococcoidia bacterium]|nr:hypothetical protein [Dehalococcoidia bacterium]
MPALHRTLDLRVPVDDIPLYHVPTAIRPRSWRHSLPLALTSSRILASMRDAPGLLRVSIYARPWRGEFLTLSTWYDEDSMRAWMPTEPHRTAMASLRRWADAGAFLSAPYEALDSPVDWDDVAQRLSEARAARSG